MNKLKLILLYPENRYYLLVFVSLVALHILLINNKYYTINYGDNVWLESSDSEKYRLFIASLETDLRGQYVKNSHALYFGVLPLWTAYIVIAGYVLSGFMYIKETTKISTKPTSYGAERERLEARLQDAISRADQKNEAFYRAKLKHLEADQSNYYRTGK